MVSEHKEEGKLETEIYDLKLHLQHLAQLLRTGRLRQVGLHVTLFRLPAGNPSSSNAPHHPPRRSRRDPGRMKRRERERAKTVVWMWSAPLCSCQEMLHTHS